MSKYNRFSDDSTPLQEDEDPLPNSSAQLSFNQVEARNDDSIFISPTVPKESGDRWSSLVGGLRLPGVLQPAAAFLVEHQYMILVWTGIIVMLTILIPTIRSHAYINSIKDDRFQPEPVVHDTSTKPLNLAIKDVNSLLNYCENLICPNTSDTNTCYCYNTDARVTWYEAKSICSERFGSLGGKLAQVKSANDRRSLEGSFLSESETEYFLVWLGASTDNSGVSKWVDSSSVDTSLLKLKDTGSFSRHNCLVINGKGEASPDECNPKYRSQPQGYICEKKIDAVIPPAITTEGSVCCKYINEDVCRHLSEIYKTELPLLCKRQSCYFYVKPESPTKWIDARIECIEKFGMDDLVAFKDSQERDDLRDFLEKRSSYSVNDTERVHPSMHFWIGATNFVQVDDEWKWVDTTSGMNFRDLRWKNSQGIPDSKKKCLMMKGDTHKPDYEFVPRNAMIGHPSDLVPVYRYINEMCAETQGFVCQMQFKDKSPDNGETTSNLSINDIRVDIKKYIMVYYDEKSKNVFFVPEGTLSSSSGAEEHCKLSVAHKTPTEELYRGNIDAFVAWVDDEVQLNSIKDALNDAHPSDRSEWVVVVDATLDGNRTASWNEESFGEDNTKPYDLSQLTVRSIGRGYEAHFLVGFGRSPSDSVEFDSWIIQSYNERFPTDVYVLCRTYVDIFYG